MDSDENPYQAQFNQWERYYRTIVLPQQHTLSESASGYGSDDFTDCTVSTACMISLTDLINPNVDIPLTSRDSYSEDFSPAGKNMDIDSSSPSFSSSPSSHSPTETPSKFTTPGATPSEVCISNQMHNKYALSPETSAYANELYGIFNDDPFGNVDDPENLRHTYLRDFSRSSLEDLRKLPDPFPPKMRYLFE